MTKFHKHIITKQSGVIPYFIENDIIKYVLITSINSPNRWIFPKGMLEPNMSPWKSAMKEGNEEAGVYGEVDSEICAYYQYEKWGHPRQVDMYLMHVIDIYPYWEESALRFRRICTYKQAQNLIFKPVFHVLSSAQQKIQSL